MLLRQCGFLAAYVSMSDGPDGYRNRVIERSRGQLADLACAALKVIFNESFIRQKSLLQHQDTFLTFENKMCHITRTRRLSKKDFMV